MAGRWKPIELQAKLFRNVNEVVLRKAAAAIENAFINETGGHTRFPGLREFSVLDGNAPTYLFDWEQDLIAVSNSRVYRIDRAGVATDVTGVPLSGSKRAIFEKTTSELLIAAGGPILRVAADKTDLLSVDAPDSSHVGYIDGYTLAIQDDTGLFQHSEVDISNVWSDLDTFAANGKPDKLDALIITPFREIILAGIDSIEQFERLPQGSVPFFRRWSVGEGIAAPYTLVCEDQGVWGVNKQYEFVKFNGQTSQPNSNDIGRSLEGIDNWSQAWAVSMNVVGQKLILLQIPYATNEYGTMGVTFLYDYRFKRWYQLFGWDTEKLAPSKWPGWSYRPLWGRHFVGGNGKVLELTDDVHTNDGVQQRMLGRTGHLDQWGNASVTNIRMRLLRGVTAQNVEAPQIGLRVRRDNGPWTPWRMKSLGLAGARDMMVEFGPQGTARTWQWEWSVTDDTPVELTAMWAEVENAEANQ